MGRKYAKNAVSIGKNGIFCPEKRFPLMKRIKCCENKPRRPLEKYGGYRKKTFLCSTTGTPPVAPYFGSFAAAIKCAFGAAAPAAIFAGV